MLTFEYLREFNVRRCVTVFHSLNEWKPSQWSNAVAGEVGELCNETKKLDRHELGTNSEKDPKTEAEVVANIAQELADIVIYADLCAARLGIDLGDAVRDKFNRVSERYNSDIRI